jgi:hypothetical protein
MNTPRFHHSLNDVLMASKPLRIAPHVAQQVVRAQEPQGAGDPEEGEVVDNSRQHQGYDHHDVCRGREAEELPASVVLGV